MVSASEGRSHAGAAGRHEGTRKTVLRFNAASTGVISSSRRLSFIGVGLAVVTAIAAGLAIWDLREDAIDSYRHDAANLGVLLAEQTARTIQAVDLVIEETRQTILELGPTTPEDLSRAMTSEAVHRLLLTELKSLPQADALVIADARGKVVNFSRAWPVPEIDISDRDFFRTLRDHDELDLVISQAVRNRVTGAWTVYVARRISGSDHSFLGVVQGAIRTAYLESFHEAIHLQNGAAVTVRRRDGTLLTSYPDRDAAKAPSKPMEPEWRALVAQGGGTFRSSAADDGVGRLVSVNPRQDYPIVV